MCNNPSEMQYYVCFLLSFHKGVNECEWGRRGNTFLKKTSWQLLYSRLQTPPSSHLNSFLQLPVHQPIPLRTTATRLFWLAALWPSSCSWSSSSSSSSGASMSARFWRRWAPIWLKILSSYDFISFFMIFFFFGWNPSNCKSDFTVMSRGFSPALSHFSENPGTPLEAFIFTVCSCSH